jgi:hypothetical protein
LLAEKGEQVIEASSDLVTLKKFPTLEDAAAGAGKEEVGSSLLSGNDS